MICGAEGQIELPTPAFTLTDELQVQWDAGQNRLSTIEGEEVTAVMWIASILDRNYIDIEAAYGKLD